MRAFSYIALAASLLSTVSGHALITAVTGANGVDGVGFGVVAGTPRDSDRPTKVVEADTSIIRNQEIKSGKAQACGRTKGNGVNDIATELQAADAAGLPTVDSSGTLTMTMHQVNGDGAGPFTCDVSTDGGSTFATAAQVTQDVPGTRGRSNAKATNFTLQAVVPAGTTCAGGPSGSACIMRCRNPSAAGPFGGCVAFSMGGGAASAAAAGNSTAAVTAATAADNSTANASADSTAGVSDAAAAAATGATGASTKASGAKAGLGALVKGVKGGAVGARDASPGGLGAISKLFGRNNLGGARVAGGLLRSLREIEEAQH